MILYHLSHTDLDGYTCQLVSKKIYSNGNFYNANYGLEVKINLLNIINSIKNSNEKDIFLLITDLNLTKDEAKQLNTDVNNLNKDGFNIKLQLLDHHGSGQNCANKYDWYYLDTTRSATKITYEYFQDNYNEFNNLCEKDFDLLIEAVNAVDIWLEDNKYFEFGKVCMTMVSKAYEINNVLFINNNRDYRLYLISNAIKYISLDNGNILLDENIYKLKKQYLKDDKNDTMDNLSSKYLVKMIEEQKENLTIKYKQHKGLLTFTLGNISIPANRFLKENDDYDFFIDIGRRGRGSLRADNKLDVSQLASALGHGGGHPNASGVAFNDWKDTINYQDVKSFIQKKLDKLS
jgi:oligoribonuclease NrnB/cAMP/cGMP phosphodiesterase (DHH superfamily)